MTRPARPYPVHPVRGFGPSGVVALITLATLLAALLAGVDVRHQAQRVVAVLFGVDVMYDVTIYGIVAQGLMAFCPTLFPWAGIPLLVALHLAPGRNRRVLGASIVVWMFAAAGVWLSLARVYTNAGLAPIPRPAIDAGMLSGITIDLGTLAVFWVITRDRVIVLAGLVAMAIAWPIASTPSPTNLWCFVGVGVLHAIVAPAILRWGIRTRRDALRPAYLCPTCGYDRRGSPGRPCPECGFIDDASAGRYKASARPEVPRPLW